MSDPKRDRQKARRDAQRAAVAKARRRAKRRRQAFIVGFSALVAIALVVLVSSLTGDDGDDQEVASGSSTTTAPATGSASGKPCVPVADTPPAGAPAVPVKTGPPPTALVKEDLKVGDGAEVPPGATITVQYIGVACSTGKIFDSSYSRNAPATFPLSNVIKGWQDGIPGMKVGGQRLLGIPGAQAYGPQGRPPSIAPDETLWFVVEVTEVKTA